MKKWLLSIPFALMACETNSSLASAANSSSSSPNSSSSIKCEYQADSVYGVVVDPRDGQCYRTIQIGNKVWWADPLKYKIPGAQCYFTDLAECKGGLFYTWAEAMNGWQSSNNMPSGVQGLCPDGWVLPSEMDWSALFYQITSGKWPKAEVLLQKQFLIQTQQVKSNWFNRSWSSTETSSDSANLFSTTLYSFTYEQVSTQPKNDSASIRCMKVVE